MKCSLAYLFSKYSSLYKNILTRYSLISIIPLVHSLWSLVTSIEYRESVILIEPVFIQYGEKKRLRGGAFMETGLTVIGTKYVFRRPRERKLELYFLARTKSPIDKKPRNFLSRIDGWWLRGKGSVYGTLRKFDGSAWTRSESQEVYVVTFTWIELRTVGRRQEYSKIRSFREARSPGISSRPECTRANEWINGRANERTNKRTKSTSERTRTNGWTKKRASEWETCSHASQSRWFAS